jgi:hypothetical protein
MPFWVLFAWSTQTSQSRQQMIQRTREAIVGYRETPFDRYKPISKGTTCED